MFSILLAIVTFYNLNLQIDSLGCIENIIGCFVFIIIVFSSFVCWGNKA